MAHTVTRVDLTEQHTAVVRAQVPHDGIGAFLGGAFGEVMSCLAAQGVQPAGMPFSRYGFEHDGGWDVEAGFPVAQAIERSGRVEPSTLPAGPAAHVLHRGPYAEVAGAYEAATAWVRENGDQVSGAPWEQYLDGPEVPEPRTEVFVPFAPSTR